MSVPIPQNEADSVVDFDGEADFRDPAIEALAALLLELAELPQEAK